MHYKRVGACQNPKYKGRGLDELSIQAPSLRSPGHLCSSVLDFVMLLV